MESRRKSTSIAPLPLAQALPLLPTVLGGEGCKSNYAPRKGNNVRRYFQSLIQVLIQYLTATKQYACSESNKSHTPKICLASNKLTGSIVEMHMFISSINLWPLWGQFWSFIHLCTPTAYIAPYLTHSSHSTDWKESKINFLNFYFMLVLFSGDSLDYFPEFKFTFACNHSCISISGVSWLQCISSELWLGNKIFYLEWIFFYF